MMKEDERRSSSSCSGGGDESTSTSTSTASASSSSSSSSKTTSVGDGTEAADADKIQNNRNLGGEEEECSTNSGTLTVTNNDDDDDDDDDDDEDEDVVPSKPKPQPQFATFPLQLMDLIEKESTNDNAVTFDGQKVVEWISSGEKFIIRNTDLMESSVLPKYFNNKSKFMSFVRKLYRWGFRQVEKDDSGMMKFFHKKFTRGDTEKCLVMRSTVKTPTAVSIRSISNHSNRNQLGTAPNAGDVMASHLLRTNRQATYISDVNANANMLSGMGMGMCMGYGGPAFIMPALGGGASPGGLPVTYGLGMQMQSPQTHTNYLSSRLYLMHQSPVHNIMELNMNFATILYSNQASTFEAKDEDEESSAEAMLLLAKRKRKRDEKD